MPDRYHVKGTRACKVPGQPQNAPGKDMEGFYTYPRVGYYLSESDAMTIVETLKARYPNGVFFVQKTPANFDGISVPGL